MKNFVLTVALLLCSVFAFAHDEVEKPVEVIDDLELVSVYKSSIFKNKLKVDMDCFGLSCRTICMASSGENVDFVIAWEEWEEIAC